MHPVYIVIITYWTNCILCIHYAIIKSHRVISVGILIVDVLLLLETFSALRRVARHFQKYKDRHKKHQTPNAITFLLTAIPVIWITTTLRTVFVIETRLNFLTSFNCSRNSKETCLTDCSWSTEEKKM
ncbi:uncharacterized protein LOC111103301 [Crassostrea virginica]